MELNQETCFQGHKMFMDISYENQLGWHGCAMIHVVAVTLYSVCRGRSHSHNGHFTHLGHKEYSPVRWLLGRMGCRCLQGKETDSRRRFLLGSNDLEHILYQHRKSCSRGSSTCVKTANHIQSPLIILISCLLGFLLQNPKHLFKLLLVQYLFFNCKSWLF